MWEPEVTLAVTRRTERALNQENFENLKTTADSATDSQNGSKTVLSGK